MENQCAEEAGTGRGWGDLGVDLNVEWTYWKSYSSILIFVPRSLCYPGRRSRRLHPLAEIALTHCSSELGGFDSLQESAICLIIAAQPYPRGDGQLPFRLLGATSASCKPL